MGFQGAKTWRVRQGRYDPAPMLPRPASSASRLHRCTPSSRPPGQRPPRGCVSASLRRWLQAPGSLTARLRAHGAVTLQVTRQGRQTLWPQEREALGTSEGHVREVVLLIDGRPAVWARSVTPLSAVKGPWQAMKGLGTRPLAELLFTRRHVQRDPLVGERLPRHSAERQHIVREWQRLGMAVSGPAPVWCRRSVFWRRGQPLQVMESFAPWVTPLLTPR